MSLTITDLNNAKLDTDTISEVAMVGTTSDTTANREGVIIDTLNGRLKKLGYLPPVAYAAAIAFLVTDNVKTIDRNGIIYAPLPSALPFTTSGTWGGDDESKFFVIQSTGEIADLQDDVADLVSLSGVPENSTDLGSFTGSIIPDNSNDKQAMQSLETAIESVTGSNSASYGYLRQVGPNQSINRAVESLTYVGGPYYIGTDTFNEELFRINFDGDVYNDFTIASLAGTVAPKVVGIDKNLCAVMTIGGDTLQAYNALSGNTIGNSKNIISVGGSAQIEALSKNVVVVCSGLQIQAYSFDGTDWTELGNVFAIPVPETSQIGLAALSATKIAYFDGPNDILYSIEFDGADWSVTKSQSFPSLAWNSAFALDGNTVAAGSSSLSMYRETASGWVDLGIANPSGFILGSARAKGRGNTLITAGNDVTFAEIGQLFSVPPALQVVES